MNESCCCDKPTDRYKAIVLLGAPGSGKGTQGKMIGAIPGFLHSSTGDLFRSLDRNSEMGKVFLRYSTKGLLVPDEFVIQLWTQHMQNLTAAGKFCPVSDIVIMDGVPRDVRQAELLAEKIDVLKVIYLVAADTDRMVQRLRNRALKENRPDDADESVIHNRMAVYERETAPLLGFYLEDKVAKVEADQSIVRVHGQIVKLLIPIREKIERAESPRKRRICKAQAVV